jgi:hypothetical protein
LGFSAGVTTDGVTGRTLGYEKINNCFRVLVHGISVTYTARGYFVFCGVNFPRIGVVVTDFYTRSSCQITDTGNVEGG